MTTVKWDSKFQAARTKLERTVMAQIEKVVASAVEETNCAIHRKSGEVVLSGKSLDKLEFQVNGCCKELIAKIEAKLSKL